MWQFAKRGMGKKKKDFCGLVGHFEEIWSRQPEGDLGNQGRDKKKIMSTSMKRIKMLYHINIELEGTILKMK